MYLFTDISSGPICEIFSALSEYSSLSVILLPQQSFVFNKLSFLDILTKETAVSLHVLKFLHVTVGMHFLNKLGFLNILS